MAHSPYDLMISLSLDGELGEDEQQELRQHLQTCCACADTWRNMTWLNKTLTNPVLLTPPVNLAAQVAARIQIYENRRRWYPWAVGGFILISLAAAVSVSAPILFLVLGLYRPLLNTPVVGTVLSYALYLLDMIRHGALFALGALHDWLDYLISEPAALAVVLTALVLASTWIGLREGFKALAAAEMSAQRA